MKPATHSPLYVVFYPDMAEIARKHGYAMAVHGTVARDLDLICIPWTDDASDPEAVVDAITAQFSFSVGPTFDHPQGRRAWTLTMGPGYFDMSFTPRLRAEASVHRQL